MKIELNSESLHSSPCAVILYRWFSIELFSSCCIQPYNHTARQPYNRWYSRESVWWSTVSILSALYCPVLAGWPIQSVTSAVSRKISSLFQFSPILIEKFHNYFKLQHKHAPLQLHTELLFFWSATCVPASLPRLLLNESYEILLASKELCAALAFVFSSGFVQFSLQHLFCEIKNDKGFLSRSVSFLLFIRSISRSVDIYFGYSLHFDAAQHVFVSSNGHWLSFGLARQTQTRTPQHRLYHSSIGTHRCNVQNTN